MSDWTELVESFPRLEWTRLEALRRGQTADREVFIEEDHYHALRVSNDRSAIQAMEDLEAWHRERDGRQ